MNESGRQSLGHVRGSMQRANVAAPPMNTPEVMCCCEDAHASTLLSPPSSSQQTSRTQDHPTFLVADLRLCGCVCSHF